MMFTLGLPVVGLRVQGSFGLEDSRNDLAKNGLQGLHEFKLLRITAELCHADRERISADVA